MFDTLSGKLQRVFKDLRGLGKISEENVSEALRDVRLALLDADVNFKVARDFIEKRVQAGRRFARIEGSHVEPREAERDPDASV